jgi:hypothetical protein
MSSRTITGGECLSRNDEGSSIRSEVLEEVGKAVKHNETFNRSGCSGESIVTETYARPRVSQIAISKTISRKLPMVANRTVSMLKPIS